MSKHLKRQANRVFALAAVGVLAALLLKDIGLWKWLVPAWLAAWVIVQIALQHVATRPRVPDRRRRQHDVAACVPQARQRDAVH